MSALGRRTVVAEEMLERSVRLPSAWLRRHWVCAFTVMLENLLTPNLMNFTSDHNVSENHSIQWYTRLDEHLILKMVSIFQILPQ